MIFRTEIFSRFWKLGEYNRQLDYIANHVTEVDKAKSTTESESPRQKTRFYFFRVQHETVKVCKTMFMDTLSISNSMVDTAISKLGKASTVSPDKRGRHNSTNRKNISVIQQTVIEHLSLFEKVESHYCRSDTNKQYISHELSIPKMHEMYKEWMKDKGRSPVASLRQYRDVFNFTDLSFHQRKKDCCNKCYALQNAKGEEKEKLAEELPDHLNKKEEARVLKEQHKKDAIDNPTRTCMACFDLQKQLDVPKGTASAFYYKRKLIVHNFTVFDCGKKQGYCYMWTEDQAKRGSSEIGTCLSLFVANQVQKGVRDFRFFSDNCGGQNKNKNIFGLYVYLASKYDASITHTYLEVGHTQNECDSVHALIERRSKNMDMYSPDQWYAIVRGAKREGNPYIVIELNFDMVENMKDLSSCSNWNHKNINWRDIRQVRADSQCPYVLSVKCDLNEAYTEVNLRKKGRATNLVSYTPKKAYTCEVGIKKEKKTDLLSLCNSGIIPLVYHGFFKSLKEINDQARDGEDDE